MPTKIPNRQTKRLSMINKTLITPRKNQVRQQNIKYENQNTKYANQKFTLFCREAIFVANLRTFLAYFLEAKKYGGVPKRTNIRYGSQCGELAPGKPSLLIAASLSRHTFQDILTCLFKQFHRVCWKGNFQKCVQVSGLS